MRELTVVASGVVALIEVAVSRGADRKTLAERAGIDMADLVDRDARIPFRKYVALMKAGQVLCNDPALALHFGEAVDPSEISIMPSIGGFTTIDDAFAQMNRYSRLAVEVETVGNGDRMQLARSAGQLWYVDLRRNPNDFPELTESGFARMVCAVRRFMGSSRIFKSVHFTHPEPVYRAEYERIFQLPIEFGSDRNAIRLDEALVSSFRPPPSSPYVTSVLRQHADALLEQLDTTQSTRGCVESALSPTLPAGNACMDAVARKLGVSRQTLFRKLKAEGVTFEQVLDELRHTLALHYLCTSKLSVNRTAGLVGYSDATAFSRAFKRWTGSSPRVFVHRP